jgi:MFS family permease
LSLYLQDPAALGLSPLGAGLAILPATAGLVVIAPFVPKMAARVGGRKVVGLGFAITTAGFVVMGFADGSWRYVNLLVPLIAVAVGMGLSNGPASAAATAAVPANQVGAASGVSNMARYVGASVATALAATIYATAIAGETAAGGSASEAVAAGLSTASWVMAAFSLAGVALAVALRRYRVPRGTLADSAAAASAHTHTLPTSATPVATPGA